MVWLRKSRAKRWERLVFLIFLLAFSTSSALFAQPGRGEQVGAATPQTDQTEPDAQDEQTEQAEEPIRVDVNLVTLRFTVRDDVGSLLTDLGPEQFRVIENGAPQEIAFFERPRVQAAEAAPLWVAFLLDVSGSTFGTRTEEILAAQSFFENVYEFTRVGIFGFTDQLLVFQDFTTDRAAAIQAFSSARAHLGRTAIYGSVETLIGQMSRQAGPRGRKVIIVVSDGLDDGYSRAEATAALARQNDTTLYTIWIPSAMQLYRGPFRDDTGPDEAQRAKEAAFGRLSVASGGRHFGGFETILNFDNVLAEINDEVFGNLYSVGYYTEDPYLDRSERRIQVDVSRPGARVQGIFEKLPDRVEAKRQYIAALFSSSGLDEFAHADRPFHEIAADVDLLRPRGVQGEGVLSFRIKISAHSLARDERGGVRTQFGVIGQLSDAGGNAVAQLREIFRAQLSTSELRDGRGILYTNRMLAPPGTYRLKLALIEIPTWRMTVLERTARVSEP